MKTITSEARRKPGYQHRPHNEPIWQLADRMGVEVHLPAGLPINQERWLVAMELAKIARPDLGTDHLLDEQLKPRFGNGPRLRRRDWHGDGLGGNLYHGILRPASVGKQEQWAARQLLRMYQPEQVAWPPRMCWKGVWKQRRSALPGSDRYVD